jgi:hypothetical protein
LELAKHRAEFGLYDQKTLVIDGALVLIIALIADLSDKPLAAR